MEIKFNLIQHSAGRINTGNKVVQGNNFAVSDSCTLGESSEPPQNIPTFAAPTSSSTPAFNLASASVMQNSVASSIVPSPFGPALAEQLKNLAYKNVEFFTEKKFRLPFIMSPYKKISSSKAGELLEQNPKKGKAVVFAAMKDQTPIPITDQKELDRLTAYSEAGSSKNPRADLMQFLKSTENSRYEIKIHGSKVSGGYAAYKYLTGIGGNIASPGNNVDISMSGVTLLSIGSKDLADIGNLEKRLTAEKEKFNDLGGSEKLYKALYESPGGAPVGDKLTILKDIYNNSYGDTGKKRVSRVMDQYNLIRHSSKDDNDFIKTGKLYSEFLVARKNSHWDDKNQISALKFIIEDLKDRPEDFNRFIQLVGDRVPVGGAINMYKNLSQPPKPGEYIRTSDTITKGNLTESKHVDFLMKPAGDSTLEERVEVLNGLYKHSYNSYSEKTWKNATKAFNMIRRFSAEPGDFAKIGKMCIKMLEANRDTYWRDDYKAGIKFVATKLKDKPEDFKTFIDLLNQRTSLMSAMEIFHNVPSSSKKIDFDKAAEVFKDSSLRKPEQVTYLMEPVGDTTLKERLSIAEDIYKYCNASYSEEQWKSCKKELENLKALSKDGREFVKIGGMFVDMLKANRDTYWRKSYAGGMRFIATKMNDKPEDFKTFLYAIQNRMSIESAMTIFQDTASTSKNGTYKEAVDIFKGTSITASDRIVEVMKPVGNVSLKDRMEIAEGIYKHSGGSYSDDQWKSTLKEYNRLKSLCSNDADFLKVGKMFTEMLDAYNDKYWRKSYAEGMELIVSDLKDNPEHFASFIKMISDRMSISSAIKAYKMLPEAQKTGKLENAAELLNQSRLRSTEQVELLMEPVGSTSLKDRIEIAEGIYRHADSSYSSDSWKSTVKSYKLLKSLTKKKDNFAEMGKLFVKLLDANNDKYYRSNYSDALKLIAEKLMDSPDEFDTMIKMLDSNFSLSSAMKVYEVMPENHSKEEFEEVAYSFMKAELRSSEQIELLVKPVGDTSLDDRIGISETIYKHCWDNNSDTTRKRMTAEYQHLKEITAGSNDFVKVGKMYSKMLDVGNSRYYQPVNRKGLDFISDKLKNDPDNFNVFINFLENNGSIESAMKIYEMLPQPVKPEEYKKTADVYLSKNLTGSSYIELTMAPVENTSLEDRITIARGILSHVQGSDSSGTFSNMKKLYKQLIAKTSERNEFVKTGKLFVRILEACNSRYMNDEYGKALDFLLSGLKDNSAAFEAFEAFLKTSSSIPLSIEVLENINNPVKGEDLKTRVKAAERIIGKDFSTKYGIISRNIPQGDTIEDSGVLMGAICSMPGNRAEVAENEPVLQKIQQAKGSLKGKQIKKLVKAFRFDNIDILFKVLKSLDLPGDNESYETREDIFLQMSTGPAGITQENLDQTANIFETILKGKQDNEGFSKALSRFGRIFKFYQEKKHGDPGEVRDIYLRLMDELKKGTFHQQTPDQVTEKLLKILLVANTIESAFDQLIYASKQQEEKTIIRGETEITIGGVTLKKAKRK